MSHDHRGRCGCSILERMNVLITGAAGRIGTALRHGLAHRLRLTDVNEPANLRENEPFVLADLNDAAAIDRAVEGVDAVVHLGAMPDEAPFEQIAGPNLHGTFHVFDACRRHGVARIVFASSNHATGMYPVGEPLDETWLPRPDGLYGVSKVYGEALGRMYVDRFGLEVVALRIGSFQERPLVRRALATWLSYPDCVRLVDAALTAPDVGFTIAYGVSNNTRRWWPVSEAHRRLGYEPQDDAEIYAAEVEDEGPEYELQGGPNPDPAYGGWA
jgi:uronate dehydrogenase